jgi:hypothetical protein
MKNKLSYYFSLLLVVASYLTGACFDTAPDVPLGEPVQVPGTDFWMRPLADYEIRVYPDGDMRVRHPLVPSGQLGASYYLRAVAFDSAEDREQWIEEWIRYPEMGLPRETTINGISANIMEHGGETDHEGVILKQVVLATETQGIVFHVFTSPGNEAVEEMFDAMVESFTFEGEGGS